jgi:hypothetical protein
MNVVPLQLQPGADLRRALEAWQVIAKENHIFGFDGWQRQTTSIHCVSQAERSIGRDHRPGWASPTSPASGSRWRCMAALH